MIGWVFYHTSDIQISIYTSRTHIYCIATHCNTLQHTATHCNTLQHTNNVHLCIYAFTSRLLSLLLSLSLSVPVPLPAPEGVCVCVCVCECVCVCVGRCRSRQVERPMETRERQKGLSLSFSKCLALLSPLTLLVFVYKWRNCLVWPLYLSRESIYM